MIAAMDVLVVHFDQPGDFRALYAAQAWCRERGISYGSTDRTDFIGLLVGDYVIAKWHNLTRKEQRQVDGTITGDARNGPLHLRINRAALDRSAAVVVTEFVAADKLVDRCEAALEAHRGADQYSEAWAATQLLMHRELDHAKKRRATALLRFVGAP